MQHEAVELEEGARIEQQLDPFARGQFPFGVLALSALPAASFEAALSKGFE